ncbi:DUF6612 family protein [Halalkalibacter akibai]|uniref:Hypothetical secreted protein n=1 Tax=Halalkalibacter akibai (strain ATCC 43226 / DSM 21942 / CIP 109018 / JCM 9157 / 1139) TaxID=1236973 RepID=W4QRT5_HALA3|nr:DUF6612 family protein [Halalkalibacter akibai]GAE34024.1 hypothetical secreted protein [Halalkalibacter akibai JCM 9157]
MKNFRYYLTFIFISSFIISGCSHSNLTASEVMENSIEAMTGKEEFGFTLESHAEESDGQTLAINSKGQVQHDPRTAHITLKSDYDDGELVETEVYLSEDAIYHKGTSGEEEEWIKSSFQHTPPTPHEQLKVINEFVDSFTFTENDDHYHFALTNYQEGLDTLASTIFPFFHVSDHPFVEMIFYVYRQEGILNHLTYEFIIDKQSSILVSESIELLLDIGDDLVGNETTFTEQLHVTYDFSNRVEEIQIPENIINKAMSYGEYIFADRELETEEVPTETKGISDGNHFNGANFTTDGEWIYFADDFSNDGIYRINKADIDNGIEKISDVSASDINVTDEWIYFHDSTDDFHVYRMKKDGSGLEKILHTYTIDLRVIDNIIYYKNFAGTNNRSLFQAKRSGATTTTFTLVDHLFRYTVHQDDVFYLTDDFQLYRTDLDPKDKSSYLLTNHLVGMFQAEDGYIYYENLNDGNTIYRTPTDGYGFEKLTTDESQGFNVSDDSIYFTNVSDNYALYKLDLNTLDSIKMDEKGSSIHVIDDLVFYQKHITSFELGWFVINKDGSDARQLFFD